MHRTTVRHWHAPPHTNWLTAWLVCFLCRNSFSYNNVRLVPVTMLCLISLNQKPPLPLQLALTLACECIPTNKGKQDILWILSSDGHSAMRGEEVAVKGAKGTEDDFNRFQVWRLKLPSVIVELSGCYRSLVQSASQNQLFAILKITDDMIFFWKTD